jgi:hypothetical protein
MTSSPLWLFVSSQSYGSSGSLRVLPDAGRQGEQGFEIALCRQPPEDIKRAKVEWKALRYLGIHNAK